MPKEYKNLFFDVKEFVLKNEYYIEKWSKIIFLDEIQII